MFAKLRILNLTIFMALLIMGVVFGQTALAQKQTAQSSTTSGMLQFTSSGHVLGFQKNGVYVATGNYVLREGFVGNDGVLPKTDKSMEEKGRARKLDKVIYSNLWKGITLIYDKPPGGILRSTYHIDPGADPEQIVLSYNVPVKLNKSGNLVLELETGTMTASAPVAWQNIKGKRMPVDVALRVDSSQRVRFYLGNYSPRFPLIIDPTLAWNTNLGTYVGEGITVDKDGDIYVTGVSYGTWGSPVHGHAGNTDAFAAKLNSNGTLIWNTFMGSSNADEGYGIAVDGSGNVYVAGYSYATWGNPVIDHTGESGYDNPDAFAAKLNSSGETVWNTFMGSSDQTDYGYGIAVDESGNAYVAGYSNATWGTPLQPFAGNTDAFAVKLNSNGETEWTTFMGSSDHDWGTSIALDGSANVYVAGISYDTWGHPVKDHFPNVIEDGFVAKLTSSGATVWNTFVGYNSRDEVWDMALDTDGNIFLTGTTMQAWSQGWGTPVNPFSSSSGDEVFVVKLDNSGETVWHTYMGSDSSDEGRGIAVDGYGNIFVTGYSYDTWGNPANGHTSGLNWDIFAAKLNRSGVRKWNTFMGVENVSSMDWGKSIAATEKGHFYITGKSPAFVAKFLKGNMTPWKPLLLLNSSE